METVSKIKFLRQSSNQIKELFLQKIPKWKSDRKHYDNTGWGFNEDSRFNACKPATISFSSHMGTYGDSGCSSQCDIDEKLFQAHLVKYLNANKEAVMMTIAKQIDEEAKELKDKATLELNTQIEQLKELENI